MPEANVFDPTVDQVIGPGAIDSIGSFALGKNLGALDKLRSFDSNTWKGIAAGALPGALLGGGLGFLGHKLLGSHGDPDDEEARKSYRRRQIAATALGALAGGYGGGSAAWKFKVAPGLGQGLAKSLLNPREAFAQGSDANYGSNAIGSIRNLVNNRPGILGATQRALLTAQRPFYLSRWLGNTTVPGMNSLAFAPSILSTSLTGTGDFASTYYGSYAPKSPGSESLAKYWDLSHLAKLRSQAATTGSAALEAQADALRDRLLGAS